MEYGPMHFQSYYYSKECRDSPWRQLLYINNFKNAKDVSQVNTVFKKVT